MEVRPEQKEKLRIPDDGFLFLVALALPWSIPAGNIAILLFGAHRIWQLVKERKLPELRGNPASLAFLGLFILSAAGLMLSSDFDTGLKQFEKHLVFFLFPILIPSISQKTGESLWIVFSVSLVMRFLSHLFVLMPLPLEWKWINVLPFHYPYFGIYAGLCCLFFFLIFLLISDYSRYLHLAGSLLFGGLTILSSSRNALIFLLLSTCLILVYPLRKKRLAVVFVLVLLGISTLIFRNHPRFTNFSEALHIKQLSWQCSLERISSPTRFLFGVGTGNAQPELQECYYEKKSWFFDFNYNSHNQYLSFLLTNGIFSLLLFCGIIGISIWRGIKNQRVMLGLIGFSLAMASMTESVFLSNKGILFYTFWICLLEKQKADSTPEITPGKN